MEIHRPQPLRHPVTGSSTDVVFLGTYLWSQSCRMARRIDTNGVLPIPTRTHTTRPINLLAAKITTRIPKVSPTTTPVPTPTHRRQRTQQPRSWRSSAPGLQRDLCTTEGRCHRSRDTFNRQPGWHFSWRLNPRISKAMPRKGEGTMQYPQDKNDTHYLRGPRSWNASGDTGVCKGPRSSRPAPSCTPATARHTYQVGESRGKFGLKVTWFSCGAETIVKGCHSNVDTALREGVKNGEGGRGCRYLQLM